MMTREELEHELLKEQNLFNHHWNEQLYCQRTIRRLEGELRKLDKNNSTQNRILKKGR